MSELIRNTASQTVYGQVNSRVDGSPITAGVSVAVSIDGGAFVAGGGGAPLHLSNGGWIYSPTQAETNGAMIAFQWASGAAINVTKDYSTRGGDAFTRLGVPAGASIAADIAQIQAEELLEATASALAALSAKIGNPAGATLAADIAALAGTLAAGVGLNAAERAALSTALLDLANGVEIGITVRQALRLIGAACAGQAGGGSTTTMTFQAMGNPGTTRISATVDASGDRTAINLTP